MILAAGRGSRMESATASKPKCLIEVGGQPLIRHQIEMLRQCGIDDVLVVAGYRADDVETATAGQAEVIRSGLWDRTNSLYSLSLCQQHIRESMVVMNCDVLAHPAVLRRVLDAPGSAFAYDSATGTDDEHMKVALRQGLLVAMSKDMDPLRSRGENVGLLRFDADAAEALFRETDAVLAEGNMNMWMAKAVERVAQYQPLHAIDVADLPWVEIDFPEDLAQARH